MPLALNAIFGIPTREEKFTAARDQKLQDFHKELMGEQERIRREGSKYDWEEGKGRVASTLVGAGYTPEAAQKIVAQSLSTPAMAESVRFSTLEGVKPFANVIGSSESERTIEENKAGKENAINLGEFGRAIRPFVKTSATEGELLKEKQRVAAMQQAALQADQARQDRSMLEKTGNLQTAAEVARLTAAPLLSNQGVKMGESTLAGADTQNKIAAENLAEAQRMNKLRSTLAPDVAAAEVQMPGELAQTRIDEARAARKYLQEHPEIIPQLMGIYKPMDPNKTGWQNLMPQGSAGPADAPYSRASTLDPESAKLINILLGQPQ